MDRYSDVLLFGASSPLFFSGLDRCLDFSYSGPRNHYFSGMDRYLDFLLFGVSSPLFFRNGQIFGLSFIRCLVSTIFQGWTNIRHFSYSGRRLHYFSGMDRYSDRSLVSIIFQGWTDNWTFFYLGPRLHYFSGMNRYSHRRLVSIIFQGLTDTRTFFYPGPSLHYF